jgi:hypothetical protein
MPANGHANGSIPGPVAKDSSPPTFFNAGTQAHFSPEQVRDFVSRLEVPFDPSVVEWRVTNTSRNGKPRGQVMPYADQRAYTDRLNLLFTPAGWSRKYEVHTSPTFQRGTDQKPVAKIIVTCEVTIFGLGSHSATGEEWIDDQNAGTSAEAQAFKRACCCFGLGRYLYDFEGIWVDLDERKRPRTIPQLPKWATPQGWVQGLRSNPPAEPGSASGKQAQSNSGSLVSEIEAMAGILGRGLYRGLLRDLARVWNPRDIKEYALQEKVLEHMHVAERGISRLKAAIDRTGTEPLTRVLKSLGIASLERMENLETLKRVVVALEEIAAAKNR